MVTIVGWTHISIGELLNTDAGYPALWRQRDNYFYLSNGHPILNSIGARIPQRPWYEIPLSLYAGRPFVARRGYSHRYVLEPDGHSQPNM